jgi:hypothetical protein
MKAFCYKTIFGRFGRVIDDSVSDFGDVTKV